jgi:hypothetical protein
MLTNERGLMEQQTKLFDCPTFILRNTLSSLGIITIGLSRTDCIYKLHLLGHDTLCTSSLPNKQSPFKGIEKIPSQPKVNNSRSVGRALQPTISESPPIVSITHPIKTPNNAKLFEPKHILYDTSFTNLRSKQLDVHNEVIVNNLNIKETLSDTVSNNLMVQNVISNFQSNLDTVHSNLETKFEWKGFKNIKNPYIRTNNRKGTYTQIKYLSNRNLNFNLNKSYIFLREYDNLYDITIELKDVNIVTNFEEHRTHFELLDISSLLGLTFTDEIQVPFLRIIRDINNIDYAMNPGASITNGKLWVTTSLFTTHVRSIRVKTPNLPATIRLNYTTQKKDYSMENILNPFMSGMRENEIIRENIECNLYDVSTISCIHNWVDSNDSVNLNTRTILRVNQLQQLPEYIQITYPIPRNHNPVFDFNGNGIFYINSVQSGKVDVNVFSDNPFVYVYLVFDNESLTQVDGIIEIVTSIKYHILNTSPLLITPIIYTTNTIVHNYIVINNINVFDTITSYGNLDISEYYNFNYNLIENDHSFTSIYPEITYNISMMFDNIHVNNVFVTDTKSISNQLDGPLQSTYTVNVSIIEHPQYTSYAIKSPYDLYYDELSFSPSTNPTITFNYLDSLFDSNPYILQTISSITFVTKQTIQNVPGTIDYTFDGYKTIVNMTESLKIENHYIHIINIRDILNHFIDPSQFKQMSFDVHYG